MGSETGVVVMWICGACDGILVMPSNYMLIRYVVHFFKELDVISLSHMITFH